MLWQYIQDSLKGWQSRSKLINEASPSGDFDLWQTHVAIGDVLKVPVIGDAFELAIEVPSRAMEGQRNLSTEPDSSRKHRPRCRQELINPLISPEGVRVTITLRSIIQ